jgi:hypothetical protein
VQAETELNSVDTKNAPTTFEKSESLPQEKKGNILNIILDRSPEISTTRGTLVIEAFIDTNNNKIWDPNELSIKDEVVCSIDKTKYSIPAFIPALDYNARYKISCVGSSQYQPTVEQKNVLIARRGQIINMAIPCRNTTP